MGYCRRRTTNMSEMPPLSLSFSLLSALLNIRIPLSLPSNVLVLVLHTLPRLYFHSSLPSLTSLKQLSFLLALSPLHPPPLHIYSPLPHYHLPSLFSLILCPLFLPLFIFPIPVLPFLLPFRCPAAVWSARILKASGEQSAPIMPPIEKAVLMGAIDLPRLRGWLTSRA